ncbi:glutamate racemase [Pantoea sp. V108_6]|uniref:glutamate racemase n=1 Tax=Pantoea sp. V108_6 TaxID=3044235 RepID=UPI00249E9FEC|nr:glutamate racemase [Pantoea sp. V108_6]MDI3364033.1 glutamate racemase [Pantoea sp. V108_6]
MMRDIFQRKSQHVSNIACLHTAASNIAIFDDAARQLELDHLQLSHLVMPHLLAEAEASGGLTAGLHERLVALLRDLQPHFDVILITCSTLGPVSEAFTSSRQPCAVWRTDGMLAKAVHQSAKKTVVLCAAESTLGATRALFCTDGQTPEIRLIPEAWQRFKAGDGAGYFHCVRTAVENAWQQGAERVVLAQSSMAPVAQQFPPERQPLSGPHLALLQCHQQANR